MITEEEPPQVSKRVKVFGAIIWFLLTMVIFTVVTYTLAQVWPYDQANVEITRELEAQTYTSDGVPVIYAGEDLRYEVTICNRGVDISTDWWLDSYGPVLPGTSNLEIPDQALVSSERIRTAIFYESLNVGCVDNIEITSPIPNEIQRGIYYVLRTTNRYTANPVREINNIVETELFYYADPGTPIP